MKLLTVLIEVPDEHAEDAFKEMLSEFADQIVSADAETLTVRLRDDRDFSEGK